MKTTILFIVACLMFIAAPGVEAQLISLSISSAPKEVAYKKILVNATDVWGNKLYDCWGNPIMREALVPAYVSDGFCTESIGATIILGGHGHVDHGWGGHGGPPRGHWHHK